MNRFSVWLFKLSLGLVFIAETGCQSLISTSKPEASLDSSNCLEYGDNKNFNERRIKAFQEIIQNQMIILKTTPSNQPGRNLLAKIELIRRRSSQPFLQPEMTPQTVSKIIRRESAQLIEILGTNAPKTPNTINTGLYLKKTFLPSLENHARWNCLQPADKK